MGNDIVKSGVQVTDGLFSVELNVTHGDFDGQGLWLEVEVGGMAIGCQEILPVPYALSLRLGAQIIGSNSTLLLLSGGATALSATGTTYGIYSKSTAASGYTYGVWAESASDAGRGVLGYATSTDGADARGVWGLSDSVSGKGVVGTASATSGTNYGVWGESASTSGRGVLGVATATSGAAYGVYGQSRSANGRGVFGQATSASGQTYGVYGESASPDGWGVYGLGGASSGTNYGVYGWTNSTSGYGGYFWGDVYVNGDFGASGTKAFKIDHPLDPENQYLYHFAQESPEVQNIYNGVVVLDANGEAVITLPGYFAALNTGPYRYQLTAIGAPMPNLYIADEIEGTIFRIAGGVPGKSVSWEVTAVRNDPYLRDHPVQTEQDKPADEQGTYLYPEGYGQPQEMGLDYQRNATVIEQLSGDSRASDGE